MSELENLMCELVFAMGRPEGKPHAPFYGVSTTRRMIKYPKDGSTDDFGQIVSQLKIAYSRFALEPRKG